MCLGQAVIHGSSSIFNSTVNHPRFNDIVLTSIIDSYLNHADPDPPDADEIRHNLGRAMQLIRDINNLENQVANEGRTAERDANLNFLRNSLEETIRILPGTDTLNNLHLSADPDAFFEVMCMNLKNNLLSFQGWLKKCENSCINTLKKRLLTLKLNYAAHEDEIFENEQRLTAIYDKRLESKVSSMKIFENLNSEQPTPAFLSLTKNKTNDTLSRLKNDDGTDFRDDDERNNHILTSFQEL
jgi:hypothetical protein